MALLLPPSRFSARRSPSQAALLLALLATASPLAIAPYGSARAQQAASEAAPVPTVLDTVTTVGDRVERPIGETTGTVTVIDQDKIDKQNLHRMQDLMRDEPGVTVLNDPRRAGAGSFNIRGLQDNRILMQIDGTRLPDMPGGVLLRGGGFTPYSRDMVDMDALKRIEVLRGPGSASYGSDALGGVVSYVTKDPLDYLPGDKNQFFSFKQGYDTLDSSFAETGTVAMKSGQVSALAVYTRRDGKDADTKASRVNGQETSGDNLLGKVAWDAKADRLVLIGEYFRRSVETDRFLNDITNTVRDSKGDDDSERIRVSLGHTHLEPIGFIDKIDWKLYYTAFHRTDLRTQIRTGPPVQYHIYEQTNDQWIGGFESQFSSTTDWFGLQNNLLYGISSNVTFTERLREYARINAGTGVLINNTSVEGAQTPSRFFPNTRTWQSGLFAQDEIKMGALTITPGARLDYYDMMPMPDDVYRRNPTTTEPKPISEWALSPKLGLNYEITKVYSVFAQYAKGFRAPPYDDANTGFRNPSFGYEIIPNANLQPETSNGFEVGTRGKYNDGSSYQLSGFYNRYKNFIDMVTVVPNTQFQAQNISQVEIYGAEARGDWRFMPEWSLSGGAAYAVGENLQAHTPISSVAPLSFFAGLGYDEASGLWGARLDGRHFFKHDRVAAATQVKTEAYSVFDLSAYYNPTDWITLRAGIYNILDTAYINFADVQGLTPTATVPDEYYQAGRTAAVNVTMRF